MIQSNSLFTTVSLLLSLWCLSLLAQAADQAVPTDDSRFYSLLEHQSFRNQHRESFSSSSVSNRLVLVNFMFSHCHSTCPTQTLQLVQLRSRLPEPVRAQVAFLSVSLQPSRDTPQVLHRYSVRHGAVDENWQFVVGNASDTQQLIRRLQLIDGDLSADQLRHSTDLWLLNRDGVLVQRYSGEVIDLPRLSREIQQLHALQWQ